MSTTIVTQSHGPNLSDDDSGDSIMTLDLSPQHEEVLIVKGQENKSKIHMTMKIKGGHETIFQLDTGATCNVIRAGEVSGTKSESKVTHTSQVLKMYKCRIQLTNPRNGKKYKVEFVAVKDNDADINLIGNIVAQQMNVMQVNHKNLHVLPGLSGDVRVVQALSEMGLSEKEIRTKYAYVFQGLGELGEPLRIN